MKLYEACLTLLQVYSKNNQSRKRSDATAEEDQYQDLLLIMELLTNLLSKEFIDFSDNGEFSFLETSVEKMNPPLLSTDLLHNLLCSKMRCFETKSRGHRRQIGPSLQQTSFSTGSILFFHS
ncbi:Exportin-4, partial [Goodea atripinnis]